METGQFNMKYMYNDNPICPYCNEINVDFWEFKLQDGDVEEFECDNCGKTFIVTCDISIKYSTSKREIE